MALSDKQRGATLTGYALTVALMVVTGLGSMKALEDNGETFLQGTGQEIGAPRASSSDAQAATLSNNSSNGNSLGPTSPSSPTTTPPSTTPPSTTPPSTTPPGPPTNDVNSSGESAPVNEDFSGYNPSGDRYDPAYAEANAPRTNISLTPSATGRYRVEIEVTQSGDGSADSIFVDVGNGLQRFNIANDVSGSSWHTQGLANSGCSSCSPVVLEVNLTAGTPFDFSIYAREAGVKIGSVRIVPVP